MGWDQAWECDGKEEAERGRRIIKEGLAGRF